MRPWSVLPLCALLVACRYTGPTPQTIAPETLQGEWSGQVTARDQPGEPVETVRLSALATYRGAETYDITGQLTFRGLTYNLTGSGEGYWGASLRSQTGQRPLSWFWEVTLSRAEADEVAAGDVLTGSTPDGLGNQTIVLNVYGKVAETFEGTLTREK